MDLLFKFDMELDRQQTFVAKVVVGVLWVDGGEKFSSREQAVFIVDERIMKQRSVIAMDQWNGAP